MSFPPIVLLAVTNVSFGRRSQSGVIGEREKLREKASLKTHNSLSRRKEGKGASLNSVGTSEEGKIGSLRGGGKKGGKKRNGSRGRRAEDESRRRLETKMEHASEGGGGRIGRRGRRKFGRPQFHELLPAHIFRLMTIIIRAGHAPLSADRSSRR